MRCTLDVCCSIGSCSTQWNVPAKAPDDAKYESTRNGNEEKQHKLVAARMVASSVVIEVREAAIVAIVVAIVAIIAIVANVVIVAIIVVKQPSEADSQNVIHGKSSVVGCPFVVVLL